MDKRITLKEAVNMIKDGRVIMVAASSCGTPDKLIDAGQQGR